MTPDEAISKWRTLTAEQFNTEYDADPIFRDAYNAAAQRAIDSKDPRQRFWEIDIDGWRKNQFNVDVPPARPNEDDPDGPGAPLLRRKR